MKKFLNLIRISVGVVALVAACHMPEPKLDGKSSAQLTFTQKDESQSRIKFAKTLAKALEKKELRAFLKAKALEQFDEDYDVLFHAQKSQKLVDETTLFDLLSSYHGSKQDFVDITQSLPKLTILVPELFSEKYYNSATTWDTEHFIPKVAVFDNDDKKDYLEAYDGAGKSYQFKAKGDPDELILVVKDNDRVEVTQKNPASLRSSATQNDEVSHWDYFMTDNGQYYYFSSENYNRSTRDARKQKANARAATVSTDFNVGSNSPEYRSHAYRPEAPRAYAYYKTYYSNGQLQTNTNEPFAGQFDYTIKDRMAFIRFMTMQKVQDISEQWAEGNLELVGRVLLAGRVPEAFTSRSFGGISFERLAAQFTVPGFAEQVEAGWGNACVPYWWGGCRTVNPYRDKLNELRDSGDVIFDNRGSSVNSGIWLNWRGAEILNWDAYDQGDKIILIVLEKDGNVTHTEERNWSVGLTPTQGPKDGSNVVFTGTVGGKSTVSWLDGDDSIFEQEVKYNSQYGAFKPAVSTGNTEFILRVY